MNSTNAALSKTIIGLLVAVLVPMLAKHGISVDSDGLATDLMALAGTGLAIYGRFTAKGPLHLPGLIAPTVNGLKMASPKSKQDGFSRIPILFFLVALSIGFMAAGCATVPPPQSVGESLVYLESTVTAADVLAHNLRTSGTITQAQELVVAKASAAVSAALTTARAFEAAGNPTSAQAALSTVTADITVLTGFISSHP